MKKNPAFRQRNKFNTAALIVFAVFISGNLSAMDWPSESAVMVRNFGSNDRGKPVMGMIFSGGTEILAAEKGEIIFSRSSTSGRDSAASRLHSPLGTWTAVDHGDGLVSIYSRLNETNYAVSQRSAQVEKSQPIAVSGISGWSAQNGFYFQVYDRRERRWINPAIIVTPQRETRPPQILSVELRSAQGDSVQSRNLTQGNYTVLVNTNTAASPRGFTFAPQRIICLINGAEAGSLNFESISGKDGLLMISRNGFVPVKQVYAAFPAFEAANVFLNRGQVNLEIIVQDIAGNSRSYTNRLIVN